MAIVRSKTCYNLPNVASLVPPVRYFDGQTGLHRFLGPLDRKNWKESRKKSKNRFFRHFSWLDMAISRPKTCSHWPKMVLLVPPVRYFDGQVCFYWFLRPLDTKRRGKMRKNEKKLKK